MKVCLIIILTLLVNTVSFSQSDATLEETKSWIIDKVNKHRVRFVYNTEGEWNILGGPLSKQDYNYSLQDKEDYFELRYEHSLKRMSKSNAPYETVEEIEKNQLMGMWKNIQMYLEGVNEAHIEKNFKGTIFLVLRSKGNMISFFTNRGFFVKKEMPSGDIKNRESFSNSEGNINQVLIPLVLDESMKERFQKAITHFNSLFEVKEKF